MMLPEGSAQCLTQGKHLKILLLVVVVVVLIVFKQSHYYHKGSCRIREPEGFIYIHSHLQWYPSK